MKERITPKDYIEIYNAVTNENTDRTQVLKWALCGKDYEDLEEQGLIVRLPCKIGDTIYIAVFGASTVFKQKVNHIEIVPKAILINDMTFGETVFLTRDEGENKIKELKGEQ